MKVWHIRLSSIGQFRHGAVVMLFFSVLVCEDMDLDTLKAGFNTMFNLP